MRRLILSALFFGLFTVFGYLFYVQYFRWRTQFNELGRYFDPETGVVYQAQSGLVWLSLAIAALGLSLLQLWRSGKSGR
ncbi:hypothetical protein [Pelagovum pacificum]|uniref:Uncharacterized protein n=1 Tax=Pelagovum pacificum TaxID=2588711 RepID=A0A5C5GHG8_9RHOB|nr:hypothetical protein [Pelagovum pacificum]QQA42637.1 hypothetical protein I8N54_17955 [Pelagovum pacificum]TNY34212.1 hypothetical protein FHY64_13435 [Pelagovum pacificum]